MRNRHLVSLLAVLFTGHLIYFLFFHGIWMSWSVTKQYQDASGTTLINGEYAGTNDRFFIVAKTFSRHSDLLQKFPKAVLYYYDVDQGLHPAYGGPLVENMGDFSYFRFFPQTGDLVYLQTDWWQEDFRLVRSNLYTLEGSQLAHFTQYPDPSRLLAFYDPVSKSVYYLNEYGRYYSVDRTGVPANPDDPDSYKGIVFPDTAVLDGGESAKPDITADGLSLALQGRTIKSLWWDVVKLNAYAYWEFMLKGYLVFLFQAIVTFVIWKTLRRRASGSVQA